MVIGKKRTNFINYTALELLKKNKLDNSKAINILELINTNTDIKVIPYDFGDEIFGVYVDNIHGKTSIGYNEKNSEELNRAILAHLLGHVLLSHKRKEVFVELNTTFFELMFFGKLNKAAIETQEKEANIFMASLLIPDFLLIEEINRLRGADNIILELSKVFCVPVNVMIFKLMLTDFKI